MLIPLTVGFLSGLLLGSLVPYIPFSIIVLLLIAGIAVTLLEWRGRLTIRHGAFLYGSLLFGVLYWTLLSVAPHPSDSLVVSHESMPVEGTICEPVRHGPNRIVVIVCPSESDRGKLVPRRVRLTWRDPDRSLHQGETIATATRLRLPSGLVNPGGFDYGAYLERQGIDAVGSVTGAGRVSVRSPPFHDLRWAFWRTIDVWRDQIRTAAAESLHDASVGMYLGMIIGEPDYISPETRDLFMATGTVHILSISGSHLGLIAVASFFLIRRGCRLLPIMWLLHVSRYITATRLASALTVIPVVFYTLLAGAQVATVRSLVMILIFLLAVWMGRESQVLLTLAVAAWLILLHDPQALFDISFQLSFVSVLAIAMVLQRRRRSADDDTEPRTTTRAWTWIKNYGLMTGAVTVATAPLVAHYFNQIPWAGLIGNLFVVPIAGFVLVPIGLVSAIGCLLTGCESLPLAGMNQWIGDALFRIAATLAAVPFSEWHVASPSVFGLSAFYICLALSLWPGLFRWVRYSGAVAAMVLMLCWIWSPRGWSDGDSMRVTFLDVGQGDACLIELPDRQTILIDGGSRYDTFDLGRAVVAPYLWDRGITHLDHVIGTHPQVDHVGGLAWTVQKFSVGHFRSNGTTREEAFYQRLQTSLRLHHIDEQTAEEGQVLVESGACRLRVLNPPHTDQAITVAETKHGSLLNNRSIVTRLDCGPHSFLFTADIETDAIARLRSNPWFQARVVKVPHHGAKSSLDDGWISHLRPEVAVISVGRMNPYGHPTEPVLAAYERAGARVLRTDRDGAIQVTASLSSPDLTVRRARSDVVAPVGFGPAMLSAETENLAKLWRRWTAI